MSFKTFTKFSDWLPVETWLNNAEAASHEKAGRHDVPREVQKHDHDGKPVVDAQGGAVMVPVAPDVRDERSRWWGGPGGGRLAGHVLMNDLAQGSQSAVVPVMLMLVTVLTVLAATAGFSSLMGALSVLGVVGLCTLLWHSMGKDGLCRMAVFSILVPALGVKWTLEGQGVLPMVQGQGAQMMNMGLAGAVLTAAFVAVVVYGFVGNRDSARSGLIAFAKYGSLFAVYAALTAFLPSFLQPMLWAGVGCFVPYWNEKMLRVARAYELSLVATEFAGDDSTLGNNSLEERTKQAINIEKDKSGFMPLGTAQGILTRYGDGNAPDKGLWVGLSPKDLGTHLHVFGETGGGKTFNVMAPLAFWWILNRAGGMLCLDGKGALPESILAKLVGLPNVLLIKPGVKLGLMDGLSPTDFAKAISDVAGAKKQEKAADTDSFFNGHAQSLALYLAVILQGLNHLGLVREKKGGNRSYHWTLSSFDEIKTLLQKKSPEGEAVLQRAKALIGIDRDEPTEDELAEAPELASEVQTFNEHAAAYRSGVEKEFGPVSPLFQDALNYIELEYWNMAEDTRSSINSVLKNWLAPLMQNEELRVWADTENGEDPTICLRGGYVGMCLPEFQYGVAGQLCQSFIRHRVMAAIRRRVTRKNWREMGETPVLFVVDEAQEMVTQADREFLAVAREHGGACVYGTQSYSEYVARMGQAATDAFLANFLSFVVLPTSGSHATYDYISKRMPEGEYISWESGTGRVLGFVQSLKKLGNHPMFDKSHPMYSEMRKLRRKGAAQLRVPKRFRVMSANQGDHYHDMKKMDDLSHLHTPVVTSGKKEVRPLVTLQDCAKYLNPQTALVTLKRGGGVRRDFIKFPTMTDEQIEERLERVREAVVFNHILTIIENQVKDAAGVKLSKTESYNRTAAFLKLMVDDTGFTRLGLGDPADRHAMQRLNTKLADKATQEMALGADPEAIKTAIVAQWLKENLEAMEA